MELKPRILITGFEPFGTSEVNPTEMLVMALPDLLCSEGNYTIDTLVLPVTAEASDIVFEQLESMDEQSYDIVLHLGLNMKIEDIAIERIAVNIDDYRIPDNEGNQVIDRSIDPEGPAAYFSMLPVRRIEKGLQDHDIPCHVSNSAGTYLCNHLMYTTLTYIQRNECTTKAGFVHVPPLEHMGINAMLGAILNILDVLTNGHE